MTFSKTHPKCKNCLHFDDCDNKRMVACAFAECKPAFQDAQAALTLPIAAELLVKHDYRDIKIDANTTITIDIDDMKMQLEREIYKAFGCGFLEYGG